jgi:hypothetical protein
MITQQMIEAGARPLRAYLPDVSFGESELLARRVLAAALYQERIVEDPHWGIAFYSRVEINPIEHEQTK